MIILPAIDLHGGTCVRLVKGDFGTSRKVADDPLETARRFEAAGARWLHMVDLDGAKTGNKVNRGIILSVIRNTGLNIEIGGGIRAMADIEDYLSNGASRVILGSAALKNPPLVKEAVRRYGPGIAVGIDAKNGFVSTEGWLEDSGVDFLAFAEAMEQAGVRTLIFTDISRDGTLNGPDFERLALLKDAVSCQVTASGGIKDLGHIRRLAAMGLYGAVCGKSLYSGTLNLTEALEAGGNQDAC